MLLEINGFSEDLFGDVTPVDLMYSLGPLWSFTPGHQDAHELYESKNNLFIKLYISRQ